MRWLNKVSLYFVAVSIQAFAMFPGMTPETMKQSWDDGTFGFKVLFIVAATLATRGAARLRVPPAPVKPKP